MPAKSRITHPTYGEIEITRNPRARRIILRARSGVICITLPAAASASDLERALQKHGAKLQAQLTASRLPADADSYRIDGGLFSFHIEKMAVKEACIKRSNGQATLVVPDGCSFDTAERRLWLQKVIKSLMRERAQATLPHRLQQLAQMHGLEYRKVSIRDSRTRWGSCSTSGTISLSIYLMLLPCELIDYVLLHELCHTVEMNHSNRFWALLNGFTDGNAQKLRAQLRSYRCSVL